MNRPTAPACPQIGHVNSTEAPAEHTHWLDRAAILLSAICLVHCLALPLLVVVLPFLAEFSDSHFHAQMLWLVLPLSSIALGMGFRQHRNNNIVVIGVVGMLLLTLGGTVAHAELGLVADRVLTISGGIVLAVAHYRNSMSSRRCRFSRPRRL